MRRLPCEDCSNSFRHRLIYIPQGSLRKKIRAQEPAHQEGPGRVDEALYQVRNDKIFSL